MKADVLEQALGLDPVERAELIDALLDSFAGPGDRAVDAAWSREAEARVDAYEAGALRTSPARDVFAKLGG